MAKNNSINMFYCISTHRATISKS